MPHGKLERLMFELSSKTHGKKVYAGAGKAAAEELDVSEKLERSRAYLLEIIPCSKELTAWRLHERFGSSDRVTSGSVGGYKDRASGSLTRCERLKAFGQ
jgi:hypothetical protein